MTEVNSKIIIGVMGPAAASKEVLVCSYELGQLLAKVGYMVLTGGSNAGVMEETLKGAKSVNGTTIGILKDDNLNHMSQYVDIPIVTGLGSARNNINVLTSTVIVACGIGSGTASEIALALKANKHVILLHSTEEANNFFKSLSENKVWIAKNLVEALQKIDEILKIS